MNRIPVVALCLLAVVGCATSSDQSGKGQKPDEHAAAGYMRTISTAEVSFQAAGIITNAAMKVGEFGTLVELGAAQPPFLDKKLASGEAHGYVFVATAGFKGGTPTYSCTATPVANDKSRLHFYFVDESGIIRSEVGTSSRSPIPGDMTGSIVNIS